jgi:predicted  nucleic acid-binding Zn-ribbon protein
MLGETIKFCPHCARILLVSPEEDIVDQSCG